MNASAWTAGLIPIAVGLSFVLFRRIFSARVADPSEVPLTDEECRIYRRWEIGSLLPFFLFAPMFGYAWYLVLKGAAALFRHETPDTRFLVEPMAITWAIPAIFLGIISSAIPLDRLYRALLRDRYRRFERSCEERVGFDGNRVIVALAVLVFAGSAVFFLGVVTTFTRFTDTGIQIGHPLSFRIDFHEFTRVRAIEHRATFRAPNGATVRRPHFVIHFDDGTSWSTRQHLRDPVPEVDEQIAQLVSRRSGRAIMSRP